MTKIFFGTDADLAQVWQWLLEAPGMQVVEECSRPGQPNRWFDSWDTLEPVYREGVRNLAAWSRDFGAPPMPVQFSSTPETQWRLGDKGRTVLNSPAFIRAGRTNDQNGCLVASSLSYWSEKGARQRSVFPETNIAEIDWKKVRSVAASIQRKVKKASKARLYSYPIMPDAFERLRDGHLKLWNWGAECAYPSDLIVE